MTYEWVCPKFSRDSGRMIVCNFGAIYSSFMAFPSPPVTHVGFISYQRYNLVPANWRWCLVAGKVTVGLPSHWPRVTDIGGSPPTGSRPRRVRWASAYALLCGTGDITFTLPQVPQSHGCSSFIYILGSWAELFRGWGEPRWARCHKISIEQWCRWCKVKSVGSVL